jgi:hypothetical protein
MAEGKRDPFFLRLAGSLRGADETRPTFMKRGLHESDLWQRARLPKGGAIALKDTKKRLLFCYNAPAVHECGVTHESLAPAKAGDGK